MADAFNRGLTNFTRAADVTAAWRSLVTTNDTVGIKVFSEPGQVSGSRAAVVAALESVDAVFVFPELDARHFLEAVRPNIYAKGGDYTMETINQGERRLLEKLGVKIIILPAVPGQSTSATLQRLKIPTIQH